MDLKDGVKIVTDDVVTGANGGDTTDVDEELGPGEELPPVVAKKAEKQQPSPAEKEVASLKKQMEADKKRLQEVEESERYWQAQARQRAEPEEPEPDEEPEPGDDSPEKTVDAFAQQGIRALEARGLLTKKAARELIQKEAEKIAREVVDHESRKLRADAKLISEFKDLQDEKSPLFERTAQHARKMVAEDPGMAKSPALLIAAATAARAELKLEAAMRDAGRRESSDRIREQEGDVGFRGAREVESDTIGPETLAVLKAMKVSSEDYRKSKENLGIRSRRGVM